MVLVSSVYERVGEDIWTTTEDHLNRDSLGEGITNELVLGSVIVGLTYV